MWTSLTMLLPRLLRESLCWSKTSVLSRSLNDCIGGRGFYSLEVSRGLHSFAKRILCRKAPQRVGSQSRGVKGRRNPHTESQQEEWRKRNKTVLTYIAAAGVGMIGMSYAAVPLYRLYCQASNPHTIIKATLSWDERKMIPTRHSHNCTFIIVIIIISGDFFMYAFLADTM